LGNSSDNTIELELSYDAIENLQTFSKILNKDINTMLNEALTQYFSNEQKRLLEKNQDDENMMTNLDYDEFWDGVDI
jgi:tRNA A37 N6-isopentenylltransferase MiaA